MPNNSWTYIEVELIVADYFKMLTSELNSEKYSKAEHRRALLKILTNRTKGSIEFKHQNISAALINLGQPYIKGYLPRFNYQHILEDIVIEYLKNNPLIENHFNFFAEKQISKQRKVVDFNSFIFELPIASKVLDSDVIYKRNPIKINYLEREQNNRNLGESGEALVIDFEKWDLIRKGKQNLAKQIRWVSKDEGDGAGYDILSKNLNGRDKYVEVKTTKLNKETPFYFTRNELLFSQNHLHDYYLYRIFNFEDNPKMFKRNGSLNSICYSQPTNYKGVVKF